MMKLGYESIAIGSPSIFGIFLPILLLLLLCRPTFFLPSGFFFVIYATANDLKFIDVVVHLLFFFFILP